MQAVIHTVKAATWAAVEKLPSSVVSAKVAALTKGALKTMFFNKLKSVLAALVAVGILGAGLSALTRAALAGKQGEGKPEAKQNPSVAAKAPAPPVEPP